MVACPAQTRIKKPFGLEHGARLAVQEFRPAALPGHRQTVDGISDTCVYVRLTVTLEGFDPGSLHSRFDPLEPRVVAVLHTRQPAAEPRESVEHMASGNGRYLRQDFRWKTGQVISNAEKYDPMPSLWDAVQFGVDHVIPQFIPVLSSRTFE
jgi:hypothetical protein